MVCMLHQWLMTIFLICFLGSTHPVFLSVTEIEHNAAEQTLEVSCKVFTDDFEQALRKTYNAKIDLLETRLKPSMNVIVNDYLQKHLIITVNGKTAKLKFLGYEQQEEGIVSFYEAKDVPVVKTMEVKNDILYEYQVQQIGIIHAIVNATRKSTKLNNPESKATFGFP